MKILLFFGVLFVSLLAYGQPLKRPDPDKLADVFRINAQEQVILSFNRPLYQAGETVWFKAFLLDARRQLTDHSKVLYVDVLDEKNSIRKSLALPMESGTGWGDFALDSSFLSGKYTVRAYTNWMRNYDPSLFFQTDLIIGDAGRPKTTPQIIVHVEGGNLVAELQARIGIAVIPWTESRHGKGYILAASGDTVTSFTLNEAGVGFADFWPQDGSVYHVKVGGLSTSLPKPKTTGYVLRADRRDKSVKISVQLSLALKTNQSLYLIAVKDNRQVGYAQARADSERFSLEIPTAGLGNGVMKVALADSNYQVLADRYIAINEFDTLSINASIGPTVQVNDSLNVLIRTSNFEGMPQKSLLSVSLIPISERVLEDGWSITGHVLLNSFEQLLPKIAEASERRHSAIEYVLMSGQLKELHAVDSGHKPEAGMSFSGRILSQESTSIGNQVLTLTILPEGVQAKTISNSEGEFTFDSLFIFDRTKVIISADKMPTEKPYKIVLDRRSFPKLQTSANPSPEMPSTTRSSSTTAFHPLDDTGILLEEVEVRSTAILSNSSNLNGAGKADYILKAEDIKNSFLISDALASRVPGIIVHEGNAYSRRSVNSTMSAEPTPMAIYLDGVLLRPPEDEGRKRDWRETELNTINIHDVESIEVLVSPAHLAVYGSGAFGGAILINTKKGGSSGARESNRRFFDFEVEGLTVPRLFEDLPPGDGERSAYYWNPNVFIDASGEQRIKIPRPARAGKYKMIIEGIGDEGRSGRAVMNIEVQ